MTIKDDEPIYCDGCGTMLEELTKGSKNIYSHESVKKLLDGGVDYYCPNKECDYEIRMAFRLLAKMRERREREELARLKAKYEPEIKPFSEEEKQRSKERDLKNARLP